MKTKLSIITMTLLLITNLHAQDNKQSHFELKASAVFWTPLSAHLIATNNTTQYAYPGGNYISFASFSGYGNSLAPSLKLNYFFNDNLGISIGLNLVNLDNKLFVQETDSTFSSSENIAMIPNIMIGIAGNARFSKLLTLFYDSGIDFIPGYGFEKQYATATANPEDMNADGNALGIYIDSGIKIRLAGSLSFNTGFQYSFIPATLSYSNTSQTAKIDVETNLGGIGLQSGISFAF